MFNKNDRGHHKRNLTMWTITEDICNGTVKSLPEESLFVGDANGTGEIARDL